MFTGACRARQATVIQGAARRHKLGLVGSQHIDSRHMGLPCLGDGSVQRDIEQVTFQRHCRGLGTREAVAAAIHQRRDAVGIGQCLVSHTHGVAHPQVAAVNQTQSPAHQHRRRAVTVGAGIGIERCPGRAQQAGKRVEVGVGKRRPPLGVGSLELHRRNVGGDGAHVRGKRQ